MRFSRAHPSFNTTLNLQPSGQLGGEPHISGSGRIAPYFLYDQDGFFAIGTGWASEGAGFANGVYTSDPVAPMLFAISRSDGMAFSIESIDIIYEDYVELFYTKRDGTKISKVLGVDEFTVKSDLKDIMGLVIYPAPSQKGAFINSVKIGNIRLASSCFSPLEFSGFGFTIPIY